jgi:hypothetical protein
MSRQVQPWSRGALTRGVEEEEEEVRWQWEEDPGRGVGAPPLPWSLCHASPLRPGGWVGMLCEQG